MAVSLNTAIKPKADTTSESPKSTETRREIEATGETYETAYAALLEQVPAGWVVVGVKRW